MGLVSGCFSSVEEHTIRNPALPLCPTPNPRSRPPTKHHPLFAPITVPRLLRSPAVPAPHRDLSGTTTCGRQIGPDQQAVVVKTSYRVRRESRAARFRGARSPWGPPDTSTDFHPDVVSVMDRESSLSGEGAGYPPVSAVRRAALRCFVPALV